MTRESGQTEIEAVRQARNGSTAGSCAILRREGPRVTVRDLDTAAYIFYKRVPIIDAKQVSRTENHVVFFDPDHRVEKLAVDFANDEIGLYADAMHRLKKILRRLPGGGFPGDNGSRRRVQDSGG